MEQITAIVNDFERLKGRFTANRPETIRDKLAAWAFDGAETVGEAIGNLEQIDCAGCYSPSPFYFEDMAAEIARHWPEIDEALDSYREETGEAWTPKAGQGFLCHLWFAYEWAAAELASRIRAAVESGD